MIFTDWSQYCPVHSPHWLITIPVLSNTDYTWLSTGPVSRLTPSLDCPPLWRQQLTASRQRPGPHLHRKHDCEFIAVTAYYGFPLRVTVAWKSCVKFSDSHSTRHDSALFKWTLRLRIFGLVTPVFTTTTNLCQHGFCETLTRTVLRHYKCFYVSFIMSFKYFLPI